MGQERAAGGTLFLDEHAARHQQDSPEAKGMKAVSRQIVQHATALAREIEARDVLVLAGAITASTDAVAIAVSQSNGTQLATSSPLRVQHLQPHAEPLQVAATAGCFEDLRTIGR